MGGMTRGLLWKGFLALVLVGAVAVAGGAWAWERYLSTPLDVDGDVVFEIPPGRGLSAVARDLESRGILDHALLFALYGRLTDQAGQVRAGEYRLAPGETPRSLMARLVKGDVLLRSVTVIEGWTFNQALAQIREAPGIEVATDTLDDAALVSTLWSGEEVPGGRLEGWFFPDTYLFAKGTSDREILARGVERMRKELAEAWAERAQGLPLETPYEALILASIIEKETGVDSERPQVAGVMTRRLQKGMRLQTDPTVIYGMGDAYDGDIRRADLTRDTPYNTYTRFGLPPTPIALPGRASLRAAVAPAAGDSLYFVATGEPDGSHTFSATLAEHNAAVQRYLKRRARALKEEQ